jgi:hypothetical protein
MKQIDDDVSYSGEISIQTLRACFLAQRVFQDCPQQIWHISEICHFDSDCCECSTGNVEFVSQSDIDIRDFCFRGIVTRPLSERFEQLFRGNEKMGDALFDL